MTMKDYVNIRNHKSYAEQQDSSARIPRTKKYLSHAKSELTDRRQYTHAISNPLVNEPNRNISHTPIIIERTENHKTYHD
jgi:hypothetical protein